MERGSSTPTTPAKLTETKTRRFRFHSVQIVAINIPRFGAGNVSFQVCLETNNSQKRMFLPIFHSENLLSPMLDCHSHLIASHVVAVASNTSAHLVPSPWFHRLSVKLFSYSFGNDWNCTCRSIDKFICTPGSNNGKLPYRIVTTNQHNMMPRELPPIAHLVYL